MDDDTGLMIEDCFNRESKLKDWEREFIQSISEQYDEKGSLSDRQIEKLEQIWERVT